MWQLARAAAAGKEQEAEAERATWVQVYVDEEEEDAEAAVTAALRSGVSPRRLTVVRSWVRNSNPNPNPYDRSREPLAQKELLFYFSTLSEAQGVE